MNAAIDGNPSVDALSPYSGQVFLNEMMAANSQAFADEYGEFDDWVEVYNSTSSTVSLDGWQLGDDEDRNNLMTLTGDMEIPANGFLLVWADDQTEQGANHVDFKLSSNGETLWLFDHDGLYVQSLMFPALAQDESYGRHEDGDYGFMERPTPGVQNTGTRPPSGQMEASSDMRPSSPMPADMGSSSGELITPPIVYINELVAKNDGSQLDEYDEDDDWIELYNGGGAPTNLNGWTISDAEDAAEGYTFTQDVFIPADGYILLWADDQIGQGPLHLNFKLSKEGETLWLYDERGVQVDTVTFDALEEGISFGRLSNGSYAVLEAASPGQANAQ